MNLLFNIALYKKDNSIVDIFWGIGFIIITLYSLFKTESYAINQLIITTLVLIWGIRISTHILLKNWGKKEDPRYAAWRKEWKWVKIRSYFQVFMLQGIIMLIIAYPIIFINSNPSNSVDFYMILGCIIWTIGFIFESVGDYQLKKFLKQPKNKGKIMQSGLWRYTRHPNYFGESVMWWGIALLCFGLPLGWTAIISPLLLTYLLLYVSGVPMAETSFKNNKEFEKYKKKTSAFFPWMVILLLSTSMVETKITEPLSIVYYMRQEHRKVKCIKQSRTIKPGLSSRL